MKFILTLEVPDEYPAQAAETALLRMIDRNAQGFTHRGLALMNAFERTADFPIILMDDNGNKRGHAYFGPDLPDAHRAVLAECEAEAWRNVEQGDALEAADVASDIAQRLYTVYRTAAYDDGEPGSLVTT